MGSRKVLIIAGLISGLVFMLSWVVFHFLFVAGRDTPEYGSGESLGYLTMLIAFTTIYFGLKHYRDRELNGIISFKEAFINGMVVVLVASLFYVISWMIYYPNFIPEFMDQYAAGQIDTWEREGLTGEELKAKITEMEDFQEQYENPWFMAAITFMEVFPVGLVVTLIVSTVIRQKEEK